VIGDSFNRIHVCHRYTRDYRMWLFRHSMCALYTGLGKAHALLRAPAGGGKVNKILLRTLTMAMTPYYFFQPKKALAESYRLLSESPHSSTDFLRCCWNLFEGSFVLGALNWITLPRMTVNTHRTFNLPGLPVLNFVLPSHSTYASSFVIDWCSNVIYRLFDVYYYRPDHYRMTIH
jgi:hypothetical protein